LKICLCLVNEWMMMKSFKFTIIVFESQQNSQGIIIVSFKYPILSNLPKLEVPIDENKLCLIYAVFPMFYTD